MPIYEYQCDNCGKLSEALRKMADADVRFACEHCGSVKTRRAQSVFAAGGTQSGREMPLPMAGRSGGGCCPCGDPAGPCGM